MARAYALPGWVVRRVLPELAKGLGVPASETRPLHALPPVRDEASARALQRHLRALPLLRQLARPGSSLRWDVLCAFDEVVDREDARRVRVHACRAVAEALRLMEEAFWAAFSGADAARTARLLEADWRLRRRARARGVRHERFGLRGR